MMSVYSQCANDKFKEKHDNFLRKKEGKKDRAMILPTCKCLISDLLTRVLEVGKRKKEKQKQKPNAKKTKGAAITSQRELFQSQGLS